MAVSWSEASEITAGLVLAGRISKNCVNAKSFLAPYDKLIEAYQSGASKEDLIISVGLEPVHTALLAIEHMNGTGEADWPAILETTALYYDAGVKLAKHAEKLQRGEPVDWAKINYYAKLAQQNQGGGFTPLSQVKDVGVSYIKTGWKPIDDHLCGLPSVGLVVVGGLPGSGKTWHWVKLSSEFAQLHTDKIVATFTLEMTQEELRERYEICNNSMETCVKDRLYIYEHPIKVEDIVTQCSTIENLGLVGIDWADLLIQGETTESAMSHIYRTMVLGAKELHCPIVMYAQLNSYTGKLPRPNNLRWTRLAEALGWGVWMLYNPASDWRDGIETKNDLPKQPNSAYILAWKQRGGFRNHLNDSPGAIMIPFEPQYGWGNKSRWFSLKSDY